MPGPAFTIFDGISMCRSCCIRPSAMPGLGHCVEQCNLTMLGFQVLSNMVN